MNLISFLSAAYNCFQVGTMRKVMNFFGLKFQSPPEDVEAELKNVGKKNEVWPKTLKLLDDFFDPYNRRLASLLNDDKWLFPTNRAVG